MLDAIEERIKQDDVTTVTTHENAGRIQFQDLNVHGQEIQVDTGVNFPRQLVLPVDLERQQRKEGAVGKGQPAQLF